MSAALRISVRAIAEKAGVSPATIVRVEAGRDEANPATLATIRAAYEQMGAEFVGDDAVRLPREASPAKCSGAV